MLFERLILFPFTHTLTDRKLVRIVLSGSAGRTLYIDDASKVSRSFELPSSVKNCSMCVQ